MRLNCAGEHWTHPGENPPVGIILCSSADAALARYTLDTLPNKVMAREYQKLCRAADRGLETLIDPYGTTDPAEFFAVVTECFFDTPAEMKERHPELYDLFRGYYRQDPLAA